MKAIEAHNSARCNEDSFRQSSHRLPETDDVLYLSTCLQVFSKGAKINVSKLRSLINKFPEPLIKNYCLGILHSIQGQWPEAFIKFTQVDSSYHGESGTNLLTDKLPLCIIYEDTHQKPSFEIVEANIYCAAQYNASLIPEGDLEGKVDNVILAAYRFYLFECTHGYLLRNTDTTRKQFLSKIYEIIMEYSPNGRRLPLFKYYAEGCDEPHILEYGQDLSLATLFGFIIYERSNRDDNGQPIIPAFGLHWLANLMTDDTDFAPFGEICQWFGYNADDSDVELPGWRNSPTNLGSTVSRLKHLLEENHIDPEIIPIPRRGGRLGKYHLRDDIKAKVVRVL